MNPEQLKSKISLLLQSNEIFISETPKDLTIWISLPDSELYQIYFNVQKFNNIISIRNFQIDHSLRGLGLGSKLYQIFEEYLKSQGFSIITLHLVATSAEKFWTKNGFKKKDFTWQKTI